jgi:hypothetical protein
VSRTARLFLAVAVVSGAAALSAGCAAGPSAATLQVQPDFVTGTTGAIQAQNVVVVVDPATGAAQLTGTLVNSGGTDDQLVQATIDGSPVSVNPVPVAAHGTTNLAGQNTAKLVLSQSTSKPGLSSPVTLTFAGGGSLKLQADTAANTGVYAQFSPSSAS